MNKEDEADPDDDPFGTSADGGVNRKIMRCTCCKQYGHSSDMCAYDPNLRTANDVSEEEVRILT